MRRKREIRNLSIALVVVGLCATVVVGGLMRDRVPDVVRYAAKPEIVVLGDAPETGAAARDYRDLIDEANYHGAFAMNPEGGYGWSDNYATQTGADVAALAWCGDKGDGCEIIVRIVPEEVIEIDEQPLSKAAALGAEEFQTKPRFKALALSDLGDWGAAWGKASRVLAAAEALAICRSFLSGDARDGPVTGTCRVVWSE